MAAALLSCAVPLLSCKKQDSSSTAAAQAVAEPAVPLAQPSSGAESPPQAPLSLQQKQPAAPRPSAPVQAAASLAGHDRFLTLKPFIHVGAHDFSIGLLDTSTLPKEARKILEGLRSSLLNRELQASLFTPLAAQLALTAFGPALADSPQATDIRFGAPSSHAGGYFLSFRMFAPELSAIGELAIFTQPDGTWLLDHLELDTDALTNGYSPEDNWSPPLDF